MDDAPTSGRTLSRAPVAIPRFDFHFGFLFVVVAPVLFWSTLIFLACIAAGWTSGPELALAFFVLSSAFLTFVTRALRLRI